MVLLNGTQSFSRQCKENSTKQSTTSKTHKNWMMMRRESSAWSLHEPTIRERQIMRIVAMSVLTLSVWFFNSVEAATVDGPCRLLGIARRCVQGKSCHPVPPNSYSVYWSDDCAETLSYDSAHPTFILAARRAIQLQERGLVARIEGAYIPPPKPQA